MGIFSASSPFDQHVERATSEKNTSEDWSQIMDISDRVKESPTGAKDCLKSITKRLNSDNPRVVLQTITLLDACINNCGRKFLLEVAGREFEQEVYKLITNTRTHHKVSVRLRESLKKWAEGEFKGDPELSLIVALYIKLQKEGYDFQALTDSVSVKEQPKKVVKYSTDPNVVQSQQEEDDIAKAIQLSLQESGSGSLKSGVQGMTNVSSGLYSSASAALVSDANPSFTPKEKEPLKVRALYDFEAAEDNELTFKAGEVIIIIDNSDSNWWKGTNHRGEGLFPANFVTTDLEDLESNKSDSASAKRVSFSECVEVAEVVEDASSEATEEPSGDIDEDKIDQLLHLLHEADPTGERKDDSSLPLLEDQVNAMAPNIDAELENIDKKHAKLARISTDLVDALNLYHQLMRDMPMPLPYYSPYSKPVINTGPQGLPTYIPTNSQGMLSQPVYGPGQCQYPLPYGVSVGMPQYMDPSGTNSSQNHPTGQNQPNQSFQHMPHSSQGGGMLNYNQYIVGAPIEYRAVPNDPNNPAPGSQNMIPQPGMDPNSHISSSNLPSHGFPVNMPPNMLPQQGPPGTMQNQTKMAQEGFMTSQEYGMSIPPPQGPPFSPPSHGPSSLPQHGPPSNIPFYPQPLL